MNDVARIRNGLNITHTHTNIRHSVEKVEQVTRQTHQIVSFMI